MGWASFTAFIVAAVQNPVDRTLQPIENSPPGIQTMPCGALLGTGNLLGNVGAKAAPSLVGARSSAKRAVESHGPIKTNNGNVSNRMPAVLWAFIKRVGGKSRECNLGAQFSTGYRDLPLI